MVEPQFSPTMQEQVDLDLLQYGESEDVEVNIQSPEAETHYTEEEPSNRGGQTVELSLDEEDEIWMDSGTPQGDHEQREEMETTPPMVRYYKSCRPAHSTSNEQRGPKPSRNVRGYEGQTNQH